MSQRWIRILDNFVMRNFGRRGRSLFLVGSTVTGILFVFDYKFAEIMKMSGNAADVGGTYKMWWLRMLFGRSRSRLWGTIMNKPIPLSLRAPLYNLYASIYSCNLDEIRYPLESYRCLGHFFARTLESDARPLLDISPDSLVCPCDGEILTVGDVTSDRLEQIKGTNYKLSAFLGSDSFSDNSKPMKYCVIYLAPGDCHHFHSPCNFKLNIRRHFSGELFPVAKGFIKRFNDIFSVNERIVLNGQWTHGELNIAAVAAYNVGNIRLSTETTFRSNQFRTQLWYLGGDIDLASHKAGPSRTIPIGEHLGEFRMGSTMVLVFEAPEEFEWNVNSGTRVKVGQRLGGTGPPFIPEESKYAYYAIASEDS